MAAYTGVVEIQGYYYPINAGSVVSPEYNTLEIQNYKGEHYIWQYIPQRSEWIVNTDNESVIVNRKHIPEQKQTGERSLNSL